MIIITFVVLFVLIQYAIRYAIEKKWNNKLHRRHKLKM